jgi:CheY-like chemotaxis protein
VKRILVIDSANVFIQYVELVVARYGYGTIGVSSAREALDALTGESIDLVIAQENLPDMGWSELCQDIKSDIPIVVLTSDAASFDDAQCPEVTVTEVTTRPVSMKDLFDIIQQHLPYRNQRRQIRAPLAMKSFIHDGDGVVPCQILNLSEGGAFVMKKDPFPMGKEVHLLLPFQDKDSKMVVSGKVVYRVETARGKHPRGMGIQFNELDAGIRVKLQQYLEDHVSALLGR